MIKVAVVGTGSMAESHVTKLRKIEGVTVVAGCDVDKDRLLQFCDTQGIEHRYSSLTELLDKCDCDAVTIAASDVAHAPLSIEALEAGKHVLCEKPLATTVEDAEAMVAAAQRAGVINMVNLSYRDAPATQMAARIVQSGELGKIYHVEANYLQSWLTAKDWGDWRKESRWLWRCSTAHGSNGVLGDVGIHIFDLASYPVGEVAAITARLKTFDKQPPNNRIGEYGLDANDSALMMVEYTCGAIGTVNATRMATGYHNCLQLRVHGENGAIRVDLDRAKDLIEVCRLDADGLTQPWESLYCGKTPNNYERFISSIRSGVNDSADFARGLEVQRMLDAASRSSQNGQMIRL